MTAEKSPPLLDELREQLYALCNTRDDYDPRLSTPQRSELKWRNIDHHGTALRMVFAVAEEDQVNSWLEVFRNNAHGTSEYWRARWQRQGFKEADWWPIRVRKSFRMPVGLCAHWELEIELAEYGYELIECETA